MFSWKPLTDLQNVITVNSFSFVAKGNAVFVRNRWFYIIIILKKLFMSQCNTLALI